MVDDFLDRFPPRVRERVYTSRLGLGILIGALTVGFIAATGTMPVWLGVVTAVALFLGTPVDRMAKTHVVVPAPAIIAVEHPEDDREFDNPDSPQFETETR